MKIVIKDKAHILIYIILLISSKPIFAKDVNLLVIHCEPQDYPAVTLFNQGIQSYFNEKQIDVKLLYENYDPSIVGSIDNYNKSFGKLCEVKYQNNMPSAIVCVESDVINWLINHAPEEFKSIPTFYIGGLYDIKEVPDHFIKIEVEIDFNNSFKQVKNILPKVENIYCMLDRFFYERIQEEFDYSIEGVNVELLFNKNPNEIKQILNNAPDKSAAFYFNTHITGDKSNSPYYNLEQLSYDLPIPTFVSISQFVINDIVGGSCANMEVLGYKSAVCIDSVIINHLSESKHFVVNTTEHIYNDDALRKYNIDKKDIPSNATIINQEKTIWDYWIPISLFLLLALIEAVSIVILLWQRSRMKNAKKEIDLINKNLEDTINEQVAEIKSQNIDLKEKNKRIVSLQKHKELVTNMIVHDLKNPLAVILNYKNLSTETLRKNLIENAGNNMLNLISNILDIYKFENKVDNIIKEPFLLSELIELALSELNVSIQYNLINIEVHLEHDFEIEADKAIMKRVLINLLSNAIKNSPANSTIVINASHDATNNTVKTIVIDDGPGIAKELMQDIFDPNKEIYNSSAFSSGVGLSFCQLAIEAHNGKMDVENIKNKGAAFSFELPYIANVNMAYNKNISFDKIEIDLDYKAIKLVENQINQLRGLKIYQVSEIDEILKTLAELDQPQIDKFVLQIRKAIKLCDQNLYKNTLDELDK